MAELQPNQHSVTSITAREYWFVYRLLAAVSFPLLLSCSLYNYLMCLVMDTCFCDLFGCVLLCGDITATVLFQVGRWASGGRRLVCQVCSGQ